MKITSLSWLARALCKCTSSCILEAVKVVVCGHMTDRNPRSGGGRVIQFLVTQGSRCLDGCGRDGVSASGVTSKQRRAFGFTLDVAKVTHFVTTDALSRSGGVGGREPVCKLTCEPL